MSAFREAAKTMLEAELHCPGCGALNRPGVAYVHVSEDLKTAECSVCCRSGPIVRFQRPPGDRAS